MDKRNRILGLFFIILIIISNTPLPITFITAAPTSLLVDSGFDNSVDSADLRANTPEQDWYESRAGWSGDEPTLPEEKVTGFMDDVMAGHNDEQKNQQAMMMPQKPQAPEGLV